MGNTGSGQHVFPAWSQKRRHTERWPRDVGARLLGPEATGIELIGLDWPIRGCNCSRTWSTSADLRPRDLRTKAIRGPGTNLCSAFQAADCSAAPAPRY